MKTTLERVYEALNKVELKSEKVELGLLDDLNKYSKGYDKYYNEGLGLEKKAERIKKELKELVSALYKWDELGDSIANDIVRDLSKADKVADELGVKAEQIKEYKDAQNTFKKFAKAAKRFRDTAKKLDK